ncbi:hypothetical protein [Actinoallomurus sp. NPDC050550]|uniref:hypothetical protein n=1 Tax=Actinoallomurus sp. NPDC050550 TaxID=3154937 RepID=UPI0033C473F8
MIILSGVLVVLAIALLVTGIVTGNTGHEILGLDGLKLIYISIGISIVSALFLAVGVFLRRKELFGTAPANAKTSAGRTTARPVKAKARVGAGEDAPLVPATSASPADVPAETTVWIVPGRKRYHLETCRQLAGRDKEELTFVEAREEGFTACTACLPDTALAARAALTDIEPADDRPAEERTATATDTRPQRAALDPVEVTRFDIPVTRDAPAEEREALTADAATAGESTATEPSATDAHDAAETTTVEPAEQPGAVPTADASESLVERSRRRGRSLFEPVERTESRERTESDTAATDATATDERADEVIAAEPEPEHAEPESAKAETASPDADERDDVESDTVQAEDEPEAAEPQDDLHADETDAAEADASPRETTEPADSEREAASSEDASSDAEAPDADAQARDTQAPDTEADETATAGSEPEAAPSDEDAEDAEDIEDDEAATEPAPEDTADDRPTEAAEAAESSADATAETAGEKPAEPADEADDTESAAGPTVRILSGTKRYHRPDCALIEDIADDADDLESLPREEARERGCTPCLVCQPDDD